MTEARDEAPDEAYFVLVCALCCDAERRLLELESNRADNRPVHRRPAVMQWLEEPSQQRRPMARGCRTQPAERPMPPVRGWAVFNKIASLKRGRSVCRG